MPQAASITHHRTPEPSIKVSEEDARKIVEMLDYAYQWCDIGDRATDMITMLNEKLEAL